MERREASRRLGSARVAHLATADEGGVPHVVPLVFVLEKETVYWAVDDKPKRSTRLKRLDNIRANPNVEVVVDHYEERWDSLWWVRAGGFARILEGGQERDRALQALADKYAQYREHPPTGTVVAIDIARWSIWEASPASE